MPLPESLNLLPRQLLEERHQVVVRAGRHAPAVLGCESFQPSDLKPIPEAASLTAACRELDVESITLSAFRLEPPLIEQAVRRFGHGARLREELDSQRRAGDSLHLVYVITHFNPGPLAELTVHIGGDGHRLDQPSLEAALRRTAHLSATMLRKAVTMFPDLPALHGGKQGQWLLVDGQGQKVDGLSDEALIALGTVAIPHGIIFSNAYRELRASERGLFAAFPPHSLIRPDTGAPDVISETYWGRMCDAWHFRGIDLSYFTCVPSHLQGPPSPAAKPTGYGLATAALFLARTCLPRSGRILIESLDSVSHYTIEALVRVCGITADRIVGVDPSAEACKQAESRFGIRTHQAQPSELYRNLPADERFDIWINNGLGDDAGLAEVDALLARGVRLLCGAANNFLRVDGRDDVLRRIFDAGAIAWPDEAASGGGYAMAVMDAVQRCQHQRGDTGEAEDQLLRAIIERNRDLVLQVLKNHPEHSPEGIWRGVSDIIDARVEHALAHHVPDHDICRQANVRAWRLP